jgi:N-glycosylase/DNA lyase
MKVYENNNGVVLENVTDFNPKHIFECGQCFRWKLEEDGSYTGVVKGKILNVDMKDNKVYLNNTTLEDFNNLWYNYFDLGRDYTQIKKELKSMDEYLDKACDFGYGIRILQQDGWEMLISFIIS